MCVRACVWIYLYSYMYRICLFLRTVLSFSFTVIPRPRTVIKYFQLLFFSKFFSIFTVQLFCDGPSGAFQFKLESGMDQGWENLGPRSKLSLTLPIVCVRFVHLCELCLPCRCVGAFVCCWKTVFSVTLKNYSKTLKSHSGFPETFCSCFACAELSGCFLLS